MRFRTSLSIFILFAWSATLYAAETLSPEEILRRCDQARGNLEGVTWTVTLDTKEGKRKNSRTMRVKSRHYDVLAETLAPAKRKGHLLLMVQGNMWFYKPDLSKPVPVSKRQKLFGLAANGDISATNYAMDYDVTDMREEARDGKDYYLFDLQANSSNVTYQKVRYWVDKQLLVGTRAVFFNARGDKTLKTAQMDYQHKVTVDGEPRKFISRMLIQDELLPEHTTVMTFSKPDLQTLPDHTFNLNLLRR